MKTLKQMLDEVAQPSSGDEKAFKAQHAIKVIPHPVALETQFKGTIPKQRRLADYLKGEDEYAYDAATNISKRMKDQYGESVNLEEAFSAGEMDLDTGSVNISKKDADLLNSMFKDLNPKNKKEFTSVMMKDKSGFDEILGFAREAS